MSLVPPQGTALGALRVDEVYFEHEGPKLFTAISRSGRLYLAVMVSEGDETETYVYLPLSERRLQSLRSGGIGLRDAFQEAEEGSLFEVTADYSEGRNEVRLIAASDLPLSYLPADTAFLHIPTETRPPFEPSELVKESVSEARTLLAVEVEPRGQLRTELSLRSLSRLTGSLQDTVDALAQEQVGKPTPRGAIPGDILRETELVFRESRASSFVLIAGSTGHETKVAESTVLASSCRRLVELLAKGGAPDDLRNLVANYGPRVRTKYRALLEALMDERTGITAYAATSDGHLAQACLKPPEIRYSLSLLRDVGQEVITEYLEGVNLVGVNLRTGSFEIYDSRTKSKYSGYMDEEAREQIEGLPTGFEHFYPAHVLVQQQFSDVSNEITKTYRLIAIGARFGSASPSAEILVIPDSQPEAI